jgi:hypothetical protein
MIANDGNIMEHTVPFDGSMDLDGNGDALEHKGQLPAQSIGERYDIIVDFAKHGIMPGDKLYFVNNQEHTNGKVAGTRVPLADILSEAYKPVMVDVDGDGRADQWAGGDPAIGRFLELRVKTYAGADLSMNPADFTPGKKKMIPLPIDRDDPMMQAKLAAARQRTFVFGRFSGTDKAPWTIIPTEVGPGRLTVSAAPGCHRADACGPRKSTIESEYRERRRLEPPVHIHFESRHSHL